MTFWPRRRPRTIVKFMFTPEPDITVAELAHIVAALLDVLDIGASEAWLAKRPSLKRHFQKVERDLD